MKKLFRLLAISFFSLLCGIGTITTQKQEVKAVYAENDVVLPTRAGSNSTVEQRILQDLYVKFDENSVSIKTTDTKTIGYEIRSRQNETYVLKYTDSNPMTYTFEGVDYVFKMDLVAAIGINDIYARLSTDSNSINIWTNTGENMTGTVSVDISLKEINNLVVIDKIKGSIHVTISKPVIDTITGFFKNTSVIIIIATVCVTVIGRSAIKIFRFGVNYKSNFATVEQQEKFENAMRQELRANKTETQDAVLKICLREINRETRPLRDIQEMAEKLKTDREILDIKVSSIDQKYNEIRKLSENINQLEQKVNRLQYGEGTNEIRRSGK